MVLFRVAKPRPKKKYVICVDPDQNLYLLISSIRYDDSTHIPVARQEIGCLSHTSYINTGELFRVYDDDVLEVFPGDRISAGIRKRIREAVENHGLLPRGHERLVLSKLCGLA